MNLRTFCLYAMIATLLISCGDSIDDIPHVESSGVSTDEYNDILNKYSASNNALYDLSLNDMKEKELLKKLEDQLDKYNSAYNEILKIDESEYKSMNLVEANRLVKRLRELKDSLVNVLTTIVSVETNLSKGYSKLVESYISYKEESAMYIKFKLMHHNYKERNEELAGIRDALRSGFSALTALARIRLSAAGNSTVSVPTAASNIELTAEERTVSSTRGSVAVSSSGAISTLKTKKNVKDYASDNNFNVQGAEDYFDLAQSTGGNIAFAGSRSQLIAAINHMLAGIKAEMNKNSGDLDLMLAIDYSGSMDDDIEAVLNQLSVMVKSLEAVKRAGRRVRVGIALFGQEGHESIHLEPTESLIIVQSSLAQLFKDYTRKQHSDSIGEAAYPGLKKIVEMKKNNSSSFNAQNKAVILITDEYSKLKSQGRIQEVRAIEDELKSLGIDISVYTILTKD